MDQMEEQRRKLEEAQGEVTALRFDREQLESEIERAQNEKLRAAKQAIVDSIKVEHEEEKDKLQQQLVYVAVSALLCRTAMRPPQTH
jgi:hypothetical protein